MIPKKIHYVWLGKGQKPDMILKCINSWKEILYDYDIKEWNEDNFDLNSNNYIKKAYDEKKWAFASDLIRLIVLENEGGIYLDTDMYVLKRFDDFLNNNLVLGKEDNQHISAGMIASKSNNYFIRKCIEKYNSINERITIPRVLTDVYIDFKSDKNIKVFESIYFYPFDSHNINKFNFKNAPNNSYAVHMWNYSWGNKYVKLIKKIGVHKYFMYILNKMRIKKILKKILKIV